VSVPPPDSRLRELRLERGWTQQAVVEKVERLAWSRREPTGMNSDMLSKWERGQKGISSRYRTLLAEVYRVSVDQLGLKTAGRTAIAAPLRNDQVLSVIDSAVDLLAQLGTPGGAIRPGVLAAITEDVITRRGLLSALDPNPLPTRGSASPDELDALADRYDAAHATADPAALSTALRAHLRVIADALATTPATGARQRLMANRARVAILAGRIAAEDTGEVMAARAYYAQAIDDAREGATTT
jgi:transcriptional regulator with XRE-family HTH domain